MDPPFRVQYIFHSTSAPSKFTTVCFLFVLTRLWRNYLDKRVLLETRHDAEICSGDDAVWLQDSHENKAVINALFELGGTVDVESFRDVVSRKFIFVRDSEGNKMFPKATRYLTYKNGRPIWIEERFFDVKDHIYVWEKTKPTNKQDLNELIGFLASQPLPEHLARWQIILIPPIISDDVPEQDLIHYMVFRVHHSIGDGVSLVKVLVHQLMNAAPENPRIKRFTSKNQIWRATKAILAGPSILMERVYKPSDSSILHGPDLSGDRLVAWSNGIRLDFIKKMKNAAGMTVNDVLMASLAGAFRDYFKAHASNIPQGILCSIPVDLRAPGSKLVLDNQFAVVFLTLPTDTDDVIETLKETKQRMDFMKVSGEPIVNALSLRYCMARLPNWVTRPMFDMLSDKCTMVLSNVPGPEEKLVLAGKPIQRVVFWPPGRSKVGMYVCVLDQAYPDPLEGTWDQASTPPRGQNDRRL